MQLLINDLLSFSRQSASSSDFKKVDLNTLAKEAITELEIEIEKNNALVQVKELPVVWAVPSLMRQLFHNLLSNAIKFRKKNVEPVVQIESEKVNSLNSIHIPKAMNGNNYYKISVSDNGIGFDPKYREEIFMVFKRLHSYHEFEGSGVGLSICKKIVEKHNGFITVESKPGEGSTFMFGLPEVQSVH